MNQRGAWGDVQRAVLGDDFGPVRRAERRERFGHVCGLLVAAALCLAVWFCLALGCWAAWQAVFG